MNWIITFGLGICIGAIVTYYTIMRFADFMDKPEAERLKNLARNKKIVKGKKG